MEPGRLGLPLTPRGTWVLEQETSTKLKTQHAKKTHRSRSTDTQNKNMKTPYVTSKKKKKKSTIDFTNFINLVFNRPVECIRKIYKRF